MTSYYMKWQQDLLCIHEHECKTIQEDLDPDKRKNCYKTHTLYMH